MTKIEQPDAVRKSCQSRLARPEFLAMSYRREFLAAIQKHAPEAIQEIVETVWHGAPLDSVWLQPAVEVWCRRRHLVDRDGAAAAWMVKAIMYDLGYREHCIAHNLPSLTTNWAGPPWLEAEGAKADFMFPESLKYFRPPEYGWMTHITAESIGTMRAHILQDLERRLDAHIQALREWAKHSELVSAPIERSMPAHLGWFVRYQVNHERLDSFREKDQEAARKSLKPTALKLGLKLRPADRQPGRPPNNRK